MIELPKTTVNRSARVFLSIIGDAMGPVMNNLDKLVELPTGCGEQNMVKFAPLVSVTKYLKDTDQLDSKLLSLTKDYMTTGNTRHHLSNVMRPPFQDCNYQGFQRQLTYAHPDGSFSAFGKSDRTGGGTWLTAFVLRCLASSYELKHIEIDKSDLMRTFDWLVKIQDPKDGSFPSVGAQLLSKGLAGGLGANKKAGLSAYVLSTLLSTAKAIDASYAHETISRGLVGLKRSLENLDLVDTYTLALVFHTFKLANADRAFIHEIEAELDRRAMRESKSGLIVSPNPVDDESLFL